METPKRTRLKKTEAEMLSKQIKDLITSDNTIPDIARTLKMQRQLVEYYARYRKLST